MNQKIIQTNPSKCITEYRSLLKTMEALSAGLGQAMVFVQEDGTIGVCNQSMKEMLGLVFSEGRTHDEGVFKKGDILIIADIEMGSDDKLTPEDLSAININHNEIHPGDSFVAIGVYKDSRKKTNFKYIRSTGTEKKITVSEKIFECEISASLDLDTHFTTIKVNDDVYSMSCQESIGNIVALDGKDGHVKFFQEYGYDLRGEDIGELLRGHSYQKKNNVKNTDDSSFIGKKAESIIYGDDFYDTFHHAFRENDGYISEGIYDINRILMFCSLIRIRKQGPFDGLYLFFQTIESMRNLQIYETSIISELERRRKLKFPEEIRNLDLKLDGFVAETSEMAAVKNLAYKASQHKFNVIITGESGTGKSKLARLIHKMQYNDAPFVEVTCNAIAPSLIESELFGYVSGAFTGAAHGGKTGFFEEANGGTIFLDEIGELPMDIQIKLLDVLQNKRIYRVGSTKPVYVDVRIITATNKNLKEEVRSGNFRQDLYYRINVFPIHIPPLRDRKKDLGNLIQSVLEEACFRYEVPLKSISYEALQTMKNYNWPGNVRELENVIERALTLCDGNIIYREHLILDDECSSTVRATLKEQMKAVEKRIIMDVLERNNGNRKRTMEELDITRSVLYRKLKEYELL